MLWDSSNSLMLCLFILFCAFQTNGLDPVQILFFSQIDTVANLEEA